MKKSDGDKMLLEASCRKMNFKMKISFLFISMLVFQLSANTMNSQKRIMFEHENVTFKRILKEIKKQTGYRFFYNNNEIDDTKRISFSANGETIKQVLGKLTERENLAYRISNKHIVLTRRTLKSAKAQGKEINGTVKDEKGEPLAGASVQLKGTTIGAQTDFDGNFTLEVPDGNSVLTISYIGYETIEIVVGEQDNLAIVLKESSAQLDNVVIVGSRNPNRTSTETATAVDVIDVQEVVTKSGKIEINDILQYIAPSFNSNKQSGSDGADHIDPATLRGLGPDQTLVLINGKRRHSSSLVNVFGTRGRGNSGTDLNAIPASAIKRIEILRDGAAAQYGSDAIAGVINIILKNNVDELNIGVSYGAYNANASGDFPNGTPNTSGNRLDTDRDGNVIGDDQNFDGGSVKITANYGLSIGEDGGFVNFTTEYISKNKTLRPGFTFRRGFGEAAIDGFNVFGNASIPLSDKTEFYAFGGRNYRDTDAFAFTRNPPDARVVTSIYPNGFTPRITSIILDGSVSAGIRTETPSGWKLDFNNTYGKNNFNYFIKGTLNASLGDTSPTEFNAGGHSLSQNTTSLDLSKFFPDVAHGLNLAFGTEFRTENFVIFAGEVGSYATFDENGVPITNPATQNVPIDPVTGDPRPAGSQGFPGFSPDNEVDENRSNLSFYADAELDLSESFLLAGAVRFEEYSDFGNTLNGKLAFRVKANEKINIRGSVSTGFRAPSLPQIFYNLQFTDFVGGVATETLLSANNSPVTASFGIERLKEEKATNAALGLTGKFGDFSATLDAYYIDIRDRIVLTGQFDAPQIPNVNLAQFFVNGVDTESVGLDVVLSWKKRFEHGSFSATLAGNINNLSITSVNNGALDEQTFLSDRERSFILASAPDNKFTFSSNYQYDWFRAGLGLTRFSEIVLVDFGGTEDIYTPQTIADLNFGFDLDENLNLTIGGNNIFNSYPDQQNDENTEAGGYWDAVQQGFGGAFYYARLNFTF